MTLILVEHILSSKPFGIIFAARTQDETVAPKGTSIRIKVVRKAILGEPTSGEYWNVDGHLAHTRWGFQIDATAASRALPSGVLMRDYLARHVPGIGPDRAERLWLAYGQDLPRILVEGDITALASTIAPERPLLGPRLAAALVRAWREADAEARLVAWLQQRGVDDMRLVRRIATVLGSSAVERLEKNPWSLVALLPWERVDALGLRLYREAGKQDAENAPNRLVGAVDAAMKDVIATGATAVSDEDLRERLAVKLQSSSGSQHVAAALEIGVQNGAAVRGSGGTWRAPGCAAMEIRLQAHLGRLGIHARIFRRQFLRRLRRGRPLRDSFRFTIRRTKGGDHQAARQQLRMPARWGRRWKNARDEGHLLSLGGIGRQSASRHPFRKGRASAVSFDRKAGQNPVSDPPGA